MNIIDFKAILKKIKQRSFLFALVSLHSFDGKCDLDSRNIFKLIRIYIARKNMGWERKNVLNQHTTHTTAMATVELSTAIKRCAALYDSGIHFLLRVFDSLCRFLYSF